jgi:hypothetical protein
MGAAVDAQNLWRWLGTSAFATTRSNARQRIDGSNASAPAARRR